MEKNQPNHFNHEWYIICFNNEDSIEFRSTSSYQSNQMAWSPTICKLSSTLPAVKWVKNWRTFDWYVVNFTFDIVILVLEKFYVKLFNWWHIKLLQFQLYYHWLLSNQFMTWICQWIKSNWSNTKLIFMLLIEANVITYVYVNWTT